MRRVDWRTARIDILTTIVADTASDAAAFTGDGITVVEWKDMPGRRRFDTPSKPYQLFTTGHGLVVSCHRDWLEWSRERTAALNPVQFLSPGNIAAIVALLEPSGHELVGPHQSYGCSIDTLRSASDPHGVAFDIARGPIIEGLRSLNAFPHALASQPRHARPDVLAVTALSHGTVVACAAASDESDRLWQIGVDVLAPWRGRGIGRAVVGRLARAILDQGKVPYYSHSISNVRSAALATSLGFWPAWVQWYALEHR